MSPQESLAFKFCIVLFVKKKVNPIYYSLQAHEFDNP